jgi:hypothetical protein
MALEGNLADVRLPEILQAVAQQRRTGILTLQSETTIVAVSFLGGGVVSADSLAHTVEERLGDALADEGLVEHATIAELTRRQEAGEGRLVDLLVDEQVLSREGVLDALRRLNLSLLRELLAWREGDFKFYGGDEVAYEEGIEPISIESLLLSSLDAGDAEEAAAWEAVLGDGEGGGVDGGTAVRPAGWEAPPPGEAEAADDGEPEGAPPRPAAGRVAGEEAEPAAAAPAAAARRAAAAPLPRRAARTPAAAPPEPAAAAPPGRAVPPALALLLAAALVAGALAAPARLLLPFPGQGGDRRGLAEVQRLADRLAVDRAAKTHFLLAGRFPPSLEPLVESGLLDAEDRVGPEGRRLDLVAREDSYDIVARGEDEPVWSEAISGNFLLDPELRGEPTAPASTSEAPLVLLD